MFGWLMKTSCLISVPQTQHMFTTHCTMLPQTLVHTLLLLCFSRSFYGQHCSTLPPCCSEHCCMCCLSVSIQHVGLKALSFQFVNVWFWRLHNSKRVIFGSILINANVDMKLSIVTNKLNMHYHPEPFIYSWRPQINSGLQV